MKVICVTGPSGEIRSAAAVELTRRLTASGYKTALIKEGPPGAGALGDNAAGVESLQIPRVALWSFRQSVCFLGDMPLNDLISFLNVDWAVLEGFTESDFPKIAFLPDVENQDIWIDDLTFLALGHGETRGKWEREIPILDPDDGTEIAAMVQDRVPAKLPNLNECGLCGLSCHEVMRRILFRQGDHSLCATLSTTKARVTIGGDPVPMKAFVEDAFVGVILGFLKSLKGVDTRKNVKIDIQPGD